MTLADMAAAGWRLTRDSIARLYPYMREHLRRFGQYVLDMDDLPSPLVLRLFEIADEGAG